MPLRFESKKKSRKGHTKKQYFFQKYKDSNDKKRFSLNTKKNQLSQIAIKLAFKLI